MKRIEHSVDGLSGLEVIYPNVESIAMSGGLGGKLGILTPTAGKRDGLAFTAGNVGDAFLAEHGVGLFAQPAQFGLGIIKAASDDLGIYRIRQILPSAAFAESRADIWKNS